ncbi:MAG: DUF5119 domain-containing protein [Bacteroidales bacterium]|nr:DUF5119 domain-containing protein [Bacteroidales bacterium]
MNKLLLLTYMAGAAGMLTSCEHKDLCYDHNHAVKVNVVFDWSNAPDADPASMVLYMFDAATGSDPLRYIFSGKDGGPITLPFGTYSGLCMNSDDTDWACLCNPDDVDGFEIMTADAEELTAYSIGTRSIPRASGTESERMAATPGMLWSNRQDNIELPVTATEKTITLYPEEVVCHYTVDILDVENLTYLHGTEIDGTISGMSEGYLHGQNRPADEHVTMPFTLHADDEARTLHAEFLTFGESASTEPAHMLTVYMYLTDGSKWYYTFDVTGQVRSAADPHHVHITVSGLKLPKPLSTGGGFITDVDDWQTQQIDLDM